MSQRYWQLARDHMGTAQLSLDRLLDDSPEPREDARDALRHIADALRLWNDLGIKLGYTSDAPPPKDEPPLTERFLAALAASTICAIDPPKGSVYAYFYDIAEQYGGKMEHRWTLPKLARVFTGERLIPPDWVDGCGNAPELMRPYEQVAIRQWSGYVHPYTCNDDPCRAKTHGAPLHPKREGGWVCLHCGLHQ